MRDIAENRPIFVLYGCSTSTLALHSTQIRETLLPVVMNGSVQSKETSVGAANGAVPGHGRRKRIPKEHFEQPPLVKAIWTYIGYGIVILLGHLHDLLRKLGLKKAGAMNMKKVIALACVHARVMLSLELKDGRGHINAVWLAGRPETYGRHKVVRYSPWQREEEVHIHCICC